MSCESHPEFSEDRRKRRRLTILNFFFFLIISSNDTMKDLHEKGFKKEDVLEALRILPVVSYLVSL